VYLIVQDAGMIDKQVREALIEYKCTCRRLDKVRVPLIGGVLSMFGGRWGYLPRMHTVAARVGEGVNAIVAERWHYRGDWLHKAYDTRQVFRADYPHASHSVLPPWDWSPLEPLLVRWRRTLLAAWLAFRAAPVRPALKPKDFQTSQMMVFLDDGDQRIRAARALNACNDTARISVRPRVNKQVMRASALATFSAGFVTGRGQR
jgi:hypothetical protein